MDDVAVGIDLGTTNSCAAYCKGENLNVIENEEGKRTTPSVVYFSTPEKPIVGDYARKMGQLKPELAVFEIKRIIGLEKNHPRVDRMLKFFPFKLDDDSRESTVVIEHKDKVFKKTPSEISALILAKIKNDVELKLEHQIEKVVVTVPAYFNSNQRMETIEAAKEAGFKKVKLFCEPTAAALTYYYHNKSVEKIPHYSLVYDLGGGTFDVSILKKSKNGFEVIGVDGDPNLGGHDFDQEIFKYVCKKMSSKYDFNIKDHRRKTRRLLGLCEEAKKELSGPITKTEIDLFSFDKDFDNVKISIKQTRFEKRIKKHIDKTIQIVDRCLKSSKLSKEDIAEVILVGGSSRIPKIREMLSEYFNNKSLSKFLNPDECVAKGAALAAASLFTKPKQKVQSFHVQEITPLSLGVSDCYNRMAVIIPKNSKIPISKSHTYVNSFNEQTCMSFNIYEGERLNARKNHFLGTLSIDNLTPAPTDECEVIFTISVDENRILNVTAREQYKNNTKELKITFSKSISNETEIEHEIQSIEEIEEENKKFEEFITWKIYLIEYCIAFCQNLEQNNLTQKFKRLYEECADTANEVMKLDIEEENRVRQLIEYITKKCNPIIEQYRFESMPSTP